MVAVVVQSLNHVWLQNATGESEETTLERMKRLGQSGNIAQLWMCLVVKVVKSSAVKNNIA